MKFEHTLLTKKEQLNVFAGDKPKPTPPIRNNPGTGADAPWCGTAVCTSLAECLAYSSFFECNNYFGA